MSFGRDEVGGLEDDGFKSLLARVRAGDELAAAELVRTYLPALERVIRVRMSDPRLLRRVAVSDVCQSVMGSFFIRAALGQYQLARADDLMRLLAVMARNKIADQARKKDVERLMPAGMARDEDDAHAVAADAPSPSARLAAAELARDARARLSPELRRLLVLREQGLEWAEVAARVGGNAEALRKRLPTSPPIAPSVASPPRPTAPRPSSRPRARTAACSPPA